MLIDLITQFQQHLTNLGLSKVSAKNYTSDIRHFLAWAEANGVHEVSALTSAHVQQYIDSLKAANKPAATINRYLSSLRRFGNYLSTQHQINLNLTPATPTITPSPLIQENQLVQNYSNYLSSQQKSAATVKNYISDIKHFLAWAASDQGVRSYDLQQVLTDSTLKLYQNYLKLVQTSTSVLIRREAAIKKLADFAVSKQLLTQNPFRKQISIAQVKPLAWLTAHTIEKPRQKSPFNNILTTINNNRLYRKYHALPFTPYLHLALLCLFTASLALFGYQQIAKEVKVTAAYPSSPVRPTRQLSFQGRLTDSSNTPITTSVNAVFKLYDALSSGTQLYTSGTCSVTPDQDGIFNVLIGGNCGSEIASTVFSENAAVYMEVTVGAETLTPRQPIATVAYALNTETIQGLPVNSTMSATRNTVMVMNGSGQVILGEQSPSIKAASGTFGLSGDALSLTTTPTSGGNITIAPDSTGQVQFIGGATSTNFIRVTDANLTSGNLISGYVGNNTATGNLLALSSGSVETNRFTVATTGQVTVEGVTKGKAAVIIDQTDTGADILSASASGTTVMQLDRSGNLGINGSIYNYAGSTLNVNDALSVAGNLSLSNSTYTTTFGGIAYTWPTTQSSNYVLATNGSGTLSWSDPTVLAAATIYWTQANGSIYPKNSTVDMLVGGQTTASAKFAFINVNSGNPTATIAGNVGLVVPTGASGANLFNILNGGSLNFQTASAGQGDAGLTSRLFIKNDGSIGIGTNNPSAKLDIASGYANFSNDYGITWGAAVGVLGNATNGTVQLNTGGTSRLYVTSAGRIGIGTSVPLATFDTRAISGTAPIASFSGRTAMAGLVVDNSLGDLFTASSAGLSRFVITNAGLVGMGTGAPAYNLDLQGTATTYLANFYNNSTNAAAAGLNIRVDGNGNILDLNNNGTDVLTVSGTQASVNIPTQFTSPGDVSMAYDLNFTNPTSSFIKTKAPLYIQAGESFNSSDLTLRTFNSGQIVLDTPGGVTLNQAQAWTLATSSTALKFGVGGVGGLMTLDTTNNRVAINTVTPLEALDVTGNATLSGNLTFSGASSTIANRLMQPIQLGDSQTGNINFFNANNYITSGGNLKVTGTTTFNSIAYTWPGSQSSNYVLATNGSGTLSWSDPAVLAGAAVYWNQASGALFPKNSTADVLIGGQSTAAAKFAFINVNSGNPTATIAGNFGLVVPSSANPSELMNILNGGSLNIQTSAGGDAGLASRLYIQNNGYVGIGTNTPQTTFNIYDTTGHTESETANLTGAQTIIQSAYGARTPGTGAALGFVVPANTDGTNPWMQGRILVTPDNNSNANAAGRMYLQARYYTGSGWDWRNNLVLNSAGNVGVNTNNMLATFDVRGNSNTTAAASVSATSAKAALIVDNSIGDIFTASSAGTPRMVITNAGNVGIGTTNPTNILDVFNTGTTPQITARNTSVAGNRIAGYNLRIDTTDLWQMITDNGATSANAFFLQYNNTTANRYLTVTTGGNVGIGSASPSKLFNVGSSNQFQVDSGGNVLAPTLALGTGTIARTDRLFDINTNTTLTSGTTYTGTIQRTLSGTISGDTSAYGEYVNLPVNAIDGAYNLTTFGDYVATTLGAGATADNFQGIHSELTVSSSAVGNTGITATTAAAFVGNAAMNGNATVSGLYGGRFIAYNNAAAGIAGSSFGSYNQSYTLAAGSTITNAYGSYNQALTNVDGSNITTGYGLQAIANIPAAQTTSTMTAGYGGYFQGINATTSYGIYAQGANTIATTRTFANTYGVYADCVANSSTVTITNCYGVRGNILETSGTITNGYAGYFSSANALGTAYGVYANLTGASTTSYGLYSNVTGAGTTNYGLYINSTGATTNYGVYSNSTATNYLAGNLGIGATSTLATLDVRGLSGTTPIASFSGRMAQAGLVVDNSLGDLITASSSGTTRFTVSQTGNVTLAGNLTLSSSTATTTFGGLTYSWPTTQATSYVLSTDGSGTLSWVDAGTVAGSGNYWVQANGALYPKNSTVDFFIGGQSSTSADFAFLNALSGNPTASISGNVSLAVPTGNSGANLLNILNGGSLNIRTATSGKGDAGATSRLMILNNGNIGIGNTNPSYPLDVTGSIRSTSTIYLNDIYVNDNSQSVGLNLSGSVTTLYNKDVYQDYLQFNPPTIAEYNAGAGWVSTTVPTSLFRGGSPSNGSATITNGWTGYRLTWNTFPYRYLEDLYVSFSGNGHTTTVMVETSTDSATWTTQFTTTSFGGWPSYLSYKKFFTTLSNPYLRITFTPTWNGAYPGNDFTLYNIRYYGAYPANTATYLYTWDENRNITIPGTTTTFNANSAILSLSSTTGVKQITTGGSTDLALMPGGNLGLGTTIPNYFKLQLAGSAGPNLDNTYDLGSASAAWRNIYAYNIYSNGTVNGFWQRNSGVVAPYQISNDLVIGGSATSSALFQIFGTTGNATMAGNLGFSGTAPTITTTKMAPLTIGDASTGPIQLSPKGTTGLYVNSSGNVGVGTTTTATALTVQGVGQFYPSGVTPDNGYNGSLRVTQAAASGQYINLIRAGSYPWSIGMTYNTSNFAIGTGQNTDSNFTSPFFTITSTAGNVGINAVTPAARLDVRGSSASTPIASFSGAANVAGMIVDNSIGDLFTASSAGLSRFVISNAGLVGIGSRVPAYMLDISGAQTTYLANFYNSSANAAAAGLNIRVDGSGNILDLNNGGTDVMTVSGTQASVNVPTAFTSAGDVSMAYDLLFTNPTSTYIKTAAPLYIQAGELAGSSDLTLRTFNSGQVVIDAAGGVVLPQAQTWNLASSTTALKLGTSGLVTLDTTNNRVAINTATPLEALDVTGNATVSGNLTLAGASTIATRQNNMLTIGDASTGNITVAPQNGVTGAYIAPNTNNQVDLGTSSLYFRNIYANNIISGGTTAGFWQRNTGVMSPSNIADDLAVGGTATSSALFQIFGTTGNATTTGTLTFNTSGTIATTRMQPLTLGSASTGPIQLSPKGTTGLYVDGAGNVGVGNTAPSKMFTVGSGSPFQVDSNGNMLAPTLALGAGSAIARTDRIFDFNTTTSITNATTYTGTVQRTLSGTMTGNISDYGLYNAVNINTSDTTYLHNTYAGANYVTLNNGFTTDGMYGGYFQANNASNTVSADLGRTATTSAAVMAIALNSAATGVITNQFGGQFQSYLNSTGTITAATGTVAQAFNNNTTGTLSNAYGAQNSAFTNVDGASIAQAIGTYSRVYEVTGSTGGITTGYGGYFQGEDAATTYGIYSAGIQNSGNTETFTNTYGVMADCQVNSATNTITNCYALRGRILQTAGTISTGYAGYFESGNAVATAYGVYSTVTGAGTTNYGVYVNATGATTNYAIYSNSSAQSYFGGNIGINSTTPGNTLDVRGLSGTTAIASISGRTSNAGLLVDNSLGDLITASSAGTTRLTLSQTGNLTIAGNLTVNGGTITRAGALVLSTTGSNNLSLTSGASLYFSDTRATNIPLTLTSTDLNTFPSGSRAILDALNYLYSNQTGGGTGASLWTLNGSVLHPDNLSYDLAIGGIATTGSTTKFQIFANSGNATTTGTLTFAGGAANNIIAARNMQGLQIGDASTGNVNFSGVNVGIGTASPTDKLQVVGGYVSDITGRVTKNLLDTSTWTIGTGTVGNWGTQSNGATESSRVWGTDPFGRGAMLWQDSSDGGSDPSGGWIYNNLPIDNNKAYRSTVWVKRLDTTAGNIYLGSSGTNTLNLDGNPNANPYYFSFPASTLTVNKWYLIVGYLHANNDSSIATYSAVYDGTTGQKIATGVDYKNRNANNFQTHRAFAYYNVNANSSMVQWGPRFEEINGSEPSIESLLGVTQASTIPSIGYFGSQLGVGIAAPTSQLHVYSTYAGNAGMIVDQRTGADILTASASGTTKATLTNGGNLNLAGYVGPLSGSTLQVNGSLQMIGATTLSNTTGNMTISANGNLIIANATNQYTAGSTTFDFLNAAADTTMTVTNSNGTYRANLSVEGQVLPGSYNITNPTAIGSGAIIYRTDQSQLYFYNGASWTAIGSSGPGGQGYWVENNGIIYPLNYSVDDLVIGSNATSSAKFYVNHSNGLISIRDAAGTSTHTIGDDTANNLKLTTGSNGTKVIIQPDLQVSGGDILDPNGNTRITFVAPLQLTSVTGFLAADRGATFSANISSDTPLTLKDSNANSLWRVTNAGTMFNDQTTGASMSSAIVDGTVGAAWNLNTTSTLTGPYTNLLSVQNNSVEKFKIDANGNVWLAGSIYSNGGYGVYMKNIGTNLSQYDLVVVNTSVDAASDGVPRISATDSAYARNTYGVVQENCNYNATCKVLTEGKTLVNLNATASAGQYVFTSTTMAKGTSSFKQYDGLIGILTSAVSTAPYQANMIFLHQPSVSKMRVADKNRMHDDYHTAAFQYSLTNETSRLTLSDTNIRKGLYFDTFNDGTKVDAVNSTTSLNQGLLRTGLWGGQTYNTTNTDSAGNALLGANTVVKSIYYNRDKNDSTAATLVSLGVDPNWYNGVTLTVATTSATFSQNELINPTANPNLSTVYNGALVKATGQYSGTSRDIYLTIKSATTFDWTDIYGQAATGVTITPGVAQTLGGTGVSVTFTNTRYNVGDVFKIASWYTEASSSTRGDQQAFPTRAHIIISQSSVDIINADTQKLWLRFSQGTNYALGASTNNTLSSGRFLNGKLYVGTNGSASTGVYTLDFSHDAMFRYNATNASLSDQGIVGRNGTNNYNALNTNQAITNAVINDVDATVIPNQPTQTVTDTGWGYVKVAAGTSVANNTFRFHYAFNNVPNMSIGLAGLALSAPSKLNDCSNTGSQRTVTYVNMTTTTFLANAFDTYQVEGADVWYCFRYTATGQVAPKQFIGAATGASGTDGATSVINETDRTIANVLIGSQTAGNQWDSKVAFAQNNLYIGYNAETVPDSYVLEYYGVHNLISDGAWAAYYNFSYPVNTASVNLSILGTAAVNQIQSLVVTPGTSTIDGKSNTLYITTPSGLTVLQEKQGDGIDPGAATVVDTTEYGGSVKYYTSSYITEEMVGDTRGMWPMNSANDVTARGNNLTNTGTVTFSASGVRGTAATFNGSSQYLSNASFTSTAGTTLSWGGWVNYTTSQTSSTQKVIMDFGTGAVGASGQYGGLGHLLTGTQNVNGTSQTVDNTKYQCFAYNAAYYIAQSTVTVNPGTWHHVICNLDSTGLKIYVDGQLSGTNGVLTAGLGTTVTSLVVGRSLSASNFYWDGKADDMFFAATSLSSTQVKHMYEVGYRALQGHATTLGGGSADLNQQLAGSQTPSALTLAAAPDYNNQYVYVASSERGNNLGGGGVSKIDLTSDTNVFTYTNSSTPALLDSKISSLGVGYDLEVMSSTASGALSVSPDNNAYATSGTYFSRTATLVNNVSSLYLWLNKYVDSTCASCTLDVWASNDGGTTYFLGQLLGTDNNQTLPESEYYFGFSSPNNNLKLKFILTRDSNRKSNIFITKYGAAWFNDDDIVGNTANSGMFTTNGSVANNSYLEIKHNLGTNDLITQGWVWNTITSQFEALDASSSGRTYSIVQVDQNTTRLYNYSGSTQTLRLDVANSAGNGAGNYGVSLAPVTADVDASIGLNSIFINKTSNTGNLIRLQNSGIDRFKVGWDGHATISGSLTIGSGSLHLYDWGASSLIQSTSGSLNLQVGGSTVGVNGNSSIKFLDSAGNVTGRYDTGGKYGTGADGAMTITTATSKCDTAAGDFGSSLCKMSGITSLASAGQSTVTIGSTTGFVTGDEVLLIQMSGTGAGNYETHYISNVDSSTVLHFGEAIKNTYQATGAQVARIPQFTNFSINSGVTFTPVAAWNGTIGGVFYFRATGTVTINSTAILNMNGLGNLGSTTLGSAGSAGAASATCAWNIGAGAAHDGGAGGNGGTGGTGAGLGGGPGGSPGSAGGGASYNGGGGGGAGGGGAGGSYGGAGTNGTTGATGGNSGGGGGGNGGTATGTQGSSAMALILGAGGGAGGGGGGGGGGFCHPGSTSDGQQVGGAGGTGAAGGAGGNGGGVLVIVGNTIVNNGTLQANGTNGSSGTAGNAGSAGTDTSTTGTSWATGGGGGGNGGGGGGGSGGTIWLQGSSVTAGTQTVNGGNGGTNSGVAGGTGGSCAYTGIGSTAYNQGGGGGANNGSINSTNCQVAGTVGGNSTSAGGAGGTGRTVVTTNNYGTLHTGAVDTTNADLAENYASTDNLLPGEVVMFDTTNKGKIKRTNYAYNPGTMGIVSTKPGIVLGHDESTDSSSLVYPIALSGRVPVYISSLSDPIKIGDYLTSSDQPGKAMKATNAGPVIARAMENWDPVSSDTTIEAFVHLGYFDPGWNNVSSSTESATSMLAIDDHGNTIKLGSLATLPDPLITPEASSAGTLAMQTLNSLGQLAAQTMNAVKVNVYDLLTANSIKTNKLMSPLVVADQLIANSASIGGALKTLDATVSGNLTANDATISSLVANKAKFDEIEVGSIKAGQIEGLTATLSQIQMASAAAQSFLQQLMAQHTPAQNDLLASSTDLSSTPSANLLSSIKNVLTASDSGVNLNADQIVSTAGNFNTLLTDDLMVNNSLIVSTISTPLTSNHETLFVQPAGTGSINLLAGLMTLSDTGDVVIQGNLTVAGILATNGFKANVATVSGSLNLMPNLSLANAGGFGKLLTVYNEKGDVVASVDASGSANVQELITKQLVIAAAASDSASTATNSASISSNATIGTATIASGAAEVMIRNSQVQDNTLIYLTPISNTQNQVLFVKDKTSGIGFTVAMNQAINSDVKFNYWLIKIQ